MVIPSSNALVSVIIPTFNRLEFLPRAIQSVLAQDHLYTEVVVVDDGSTDGTETVLKELQSDRLKYIKIENSGAAIARNIGTKKAQGEYLMYLDSDDYMSSSAVRQLLEQTRKLHDKNQIACGICEIVSDHNEVISTWPRFRKRNRAKAFSLSDVIYSNPPTTSCLYHRSHIEEVRGFDPNLRILQDYDLALRISMAGYHYVYSPVHVYCMQHHIGSRVSDVKSVGKVRAQIALLESHITKLQQLELILDRDVGTAMKVRLLQLFRKTRQVGYEAEAYKFKKMADLIRTPVSPLIARERLLSAFRR